MQRLGFSPSPRKGNAVKMLYYQRAPEENTGEREGKGRMEAGEGRKMRWDRLKVGGRGDGRGGGVSELRVREREHDRESWDGMLRRGGSRRSCQTYLLLR